MAATDTSESGASTGTSMRSFLIGIGVLSLCATMCGTCYKADANSSRQIAHDAQDKYQSIVKANPYVEITSALYSQYSCGKNCKDAGVAMEVKGLTTGATRIWQTWKDKVTLHHLPEKGQVWHVWVEDLCATQACSDFDVWNTGDKEHWGYVVHMEPKGAPEDHP